MVHSHSGGKGPQNVYENNPIMSQHASQVNHCAELVVFFVLYNEWLTGMNFSEVPSSHEPKPLYLTEKPDFDKT